MNGIETFLSPEAIFDGLNATEKKSLLFEIAKKCHKFTDLDMHCIYERLIEREKLSSTGIGHGVAVPHIRSEKLTSIHGFFFRLKNPIHFDSFDNEPVDLVFFLMTPLEAGADHLQALSMISRRLKDPVFCNKLRHCQHSSESSTSDCMYMMLTAEEERTSVAA